MNFLFFSAADTVLFSRCDVEEAEYCHEEMRFTGVFPYDADKVIQRGMRVGFTDGEGVFQVCEIRKCHDLEPDHSQEITAEHIVISELTDEFFAAADWTDETAGTALAAVLTGTLWSVGNDSTNNESSASVGNGYVWPAIRTIEKNWNVYILPRITVSASGITGRYMDIIPAGGTWRGLRLSLEKNVEQAGVIWDDSNLKTALYGFGQSSGDSALTFAEVEWSATSEHPAKPVGQTYLEDTAATAAYGRNGRPRYGYYQNGDITDPEILLQKTWETLKTVRVPDVSINTTVRNLTKLGAVDVPIRLHDTALVEIRPTGVILQKEVIRFTENLLNPLDNRLTIGAYIPNIIYINRQQGGGGGGSGGQTNKDYRFHANINKVEGDLEGKISLVVTEVDGQNVVNAAGIVIAINDSGSNVLISGDKIILTGLVTANQFEAIVADFYNAQSRTLSANWITVQQGQIGSLFAGNLAVGSPSGTATWQSTTVNGVTLHYLGSTPT